MKVFEINNKLVAGAAAATICCGVGNKAVRINILLYTGRVFRLMKIMKHTQLCICYCLGDDLEHLN